MKFYNKSTQATSSKMEKWNLPLPPPPPEACSMSLPLLLLQGEPLSQLPDYILEIKLRGFAAGLGNRVWGWEKGVKGSHFLWWGSWVGAETKGWNQEFVFEQTAFGAACAILVKRWDQLIWGLQIQCLQGWAAWGWEGLQVRNVSLSS